MKLRWKITFALVGLTVGALAAVHYRVKWEVHDYQKQLQAQGEKLTIAELIPVLPTNGPNGAYDFLVATSQLGEGLYNFTPTSMRQVAPGRVLLGWKQEVLPNNSISNVWPGLIAEMESRREFMAELRTALAKPVLNFQLDYSLGNDISLPHLRPLRHAAQCLAALTILDLHEGRPADAFENLKACMALLRTSGDEANTLSQLNRVSISQLLIASTWEAIQFPEWRDEQLAELQADWESVDLLSRVELSLAMERAVGGQALAVCRRSYADLTKTMGGGVNPVNFLGFDELVELGKDVVRDPLAAFRAGSHRFPGYWIWKWWGSYEDEFVSIQINQASLDAVRAVRVDDSFGSALRLFAKTSGRIRNEHPNAGKWLGFLPYASVNDFLLPRFASFQMQRRMVVTAIALRRYQLQRGHYPLELALLVPQYLRRVPRDAMDGKPLRYHVNPDGSFLLYSVGEDGEDNNGDPSPPSQIPWKNYWWAGRDAVWPQPATAEEIKADQERMAALRSPPSPQGSSAEEKFRLRYGLPAPNIVNTNKAD